MRRIVIVVIKFKMKFDVVEFDARRRRRREAGCGRKAGGAGKDGIGWDKEVGTKDGENKEVGMEAVGRSIVLLPLPRFYLLLCVLEGNIRAHCMRERGTAHYCQY